MNSWWEYVGDYLGYPKCCREAFQTEDYRTRPVRKLDGTGYVPCAECDRKSVDDLIATINSNRKAVAPFPEFPDEECDLVYEQYLKQGE